MEIMKIGRMLVPAAFAAMLFSPAAFAQPVTKLTSNLSEATINALWCGALFLEESFYWDALSDDAERYRNMARELEDGLGQVMVEAGLPRIEVEEIWAIFDEEANWNAMFEEEVFAEDLEHCEDAYQGNKIALR